MYKLLCLVLNVVPLNAVNVEKVIKLINIMFFFCMVWIPNLSEEWVSFSNFVIVPFFLRNVTFRTPMTAKKNKSR